jgi:hypothetical protein
MYSGWVKPGAGSLLGRFFARRQRHPDEFDCAVRVVAGTVDGETDQFRYRRSALDPLVLDDVHELTHGTVRLRLRGFGEPRSVTGLRVRSDHVVWSAELADGSATVELAADVEVTSRLGMD